MTHTKQITRIIVSLLLAPSSVLPATDAAAPVKPNIVFIMADDLGWRDLGCFGSRFHRTPNLDRLATRGVRFTQAYAANPLCSPTRSSVLTGLWPARTGITAPACHVPQYRKLADPENPQRNPVYGAMVESLDDGVGRVLAALEECGLTDRTIIVFFQMAEVAVPRNLFAAILEHIQRLRVVASMVPSG